MVLTRRFRETLQLRIQRDPAFRRALLREALEAFLAGDVQSGKALLRDFINATVGFAELSRAVGRSPKSLMRMLGPSGNPQAKNLFEIVAVLQRRERVRFRLTISSNAA